MENYSGGHVTVDHDRFMRIALREAYSGCENGNGGPFGACIVREGKVVASGHNQVLHSNNPTQHAEVCAITKASKKLRRFDLSDCTIYSTTEPCVMCFAAINWAKINTIYFGTTVSDVKKLGFNELTISNKTLKRLGKSRVKIVSSVDRDGCRQLLRHWKKLPRRKTY